MEREIYIPGHWWAGRTSGPLSLQVMGSVNDGSGDSEESGGREGELGGDWFTLLG